MSAPAAGWPGFGLPRRARRSLKEEIRLAVEFRALDKNDLDDYGQIAGYAYNEAPTVIREWFESLPAAKYGLFEDGRLVTGMVDYRFDIWLNGKVVKANGVGGVASAVDVRRRGLIRRMLSEHLKVLRDDRVVVSLLYPFSFAFYRRLGWGVAARDLRAEVPPKDFAGYGRRSGRVRRVLYSEKKQVFPAPGETEESVVAALDRIYSVFAPRYNFALKRTPSDWMRILRVSTGRRYVYVWEDGDGEVLGYMVLRVPKDEDMGLLQLREIYALTPEAYRGLFYALYSHDSQNKRVQFNFPPDHPIYLLLDEPRQEKADITGGAMARVVDVARCLEERGTDGLRSGAGSGSSCANKVRDPIAPWNDGVFQVSFDGTGVKCRKLGTTDGPGGEDGAGVADRGTGTGDEAAASALIGQPDLELDVDILSGLVAGLRPVDELLAFGLATGRAGAGLDFARALFPTRTPMHNDYY